MSSNKKTWIKTGLIIAILGILFLMGRGLTNVSVQNFQITGLSGVSTEGFNLTGDLIIQNPALLSVPVKGVDYIIELNQTGETISTGNLPSFKLESTQVNKVPFEHHTRWVPTASMAVQLLLKDHVYANVKGNVSVNAYFTTYKLSFKKTFDIKQYIRKQAGSVPNTPVKGEEKIENTTSNNSNQDSSSETVVDQIT